MPRPIREVTEAQIATIRAQAAAETSLRDIAADSGLSLTLVHQIVTGQGRFGKAPASPPVIPSRSYLAQWEAQKAKRQEEAATTPQSAFEELQLLKHLLEEVGEGLRRLECRLLDMGVE
jgi:hypothetical protein